MKSKQIIWIVVILLVVIGLFSISSYLSPNKEKIAAWEKVGVECLPNGHSNLGQHIHQRIEVTVDGTNVSVPENIGIVTDCLAEIHTHEKEGQLIHVETVEASKTFKLSQFFGVWGEPFDRPGFARTVVVNNATSTDGGDVALSDNQIIHVIYDGSPE